LTDERFGDAWIARPNADRTIEYVGGCRKIIGEWDGTLQIGPRCPKSEAPSHENDIASVELSHRLGSRPIIDSLVAKRSSPPADAWTVAKAVADLPALQRR
jgi:hypothetical protein